MCDECNCNTTYIDRYYKMKSRNAIQARINTLNNDIQEMQTRELYEFEEYKLVNMINEVKVLRWVLNNEV